MVLLPLLLLLGGLGTSYAQATCTLPLPSGPVTFSKCLAVEGVGSGYSIYWTLSPDGSKVTWGMSAYEGNGYVGLGFPLEDSDNVMVGTNAFLLQSCDGCPSGALVRQVYMSGTSSGDIHPSSTIAASNVTAAAGPNNLLLGTFTTPVLVPAEEYMLIFAAGALYKNGDIRMHETYGIANLNLETGELADPETFSKAVSALVAAHIWLLIIGWGFFVPVGIVAARCLKHIDPLWFQLHRWLMSLGLLMGCVGLGLGFAIAGGWNSVFPVHRNLGLASIILGIVQATAWFLRPTFVSKWRRSWNIFHWWEGRAAVVLGVANIYYGLTKIVDTGSWGWGAYTAVFATIVFVAIAKESWEYVKLPPPGIVAHMATDGSRPALAGMELEPQGPGNGKTPTGVAAA